MPTTKCFQVFPYFCVVKSVSLQPQSNGTVWNPGVLSCSVCSTLCNPVDCSLPGSFVRGISQARILEWVAISYSKESSCPRDRACVSYIGRRILYYWATWEQQDWLIWAKNDHTKNQGQENSLTKSCRVHDFTRTNGGERTPEISIICCQQRQITKSNSKRLECEAS